LHQRVLMQISVIQAALDKVALGLLDDQVTHCAVAGHGPGSPEDSTAEMWMPSDGCFHARRT